MTLRYSNFYYVEDDGEHQVWGFEHGIGDVWLATFSSKQNAEWVVKIWTKANDSLLLVGKY